MNVVDDVDAFEAHNVLGLDKEQVGLVVWGSPHCELPDGSFSHSGHSGQGAAADFKPKVFRFLCHT